MRTKKTFYNMISSIASNLVAIIVGLIAQSVFIHVLGKEYLGLNGLFNNIISMLSIAELGIENAIIYNLYKPISEKNESRIISILSFYKRCYFAILIIVAILGIVISPFISTVVDISTVPATINIYVVFYLFLLDACFSYILSYKRSILYASQENYLINIAHIIYLILMNTMQLLYLCITKNYYGYLVIKVVSRLIENLIIAHFANKRNAYIRNIKQAEKISEDTRIDIKKKVKGSFFHKVGGYVIYSTDNIIISKYLGLVTVGLYSNYALIINATKTLFAQIIKSTTASIGNLLVSKDSSKKVIIFKRIRFINFWLAAFSGSAIMAIMESFINLWIGEGYKLGTETLIILVINYYLTLTRSTYESFKDAAGIQYEDRFSPVIESTLNIVSSIILVQIFGLPGVFLGTIISSLALWLYSYPKFIYKKTLQQPYKSYCLETIGYLILFVAICSVTYLLSSTINIDNGYLNFAKNLLVSITIPNILVLMIFKNSSLMAYCMGIFKRIKRKMKEGFKHG